MTRLERFCMNTVYVSGTLLVFLCAISFLAGTAYWLFGMWKALMQTD